MDNLDDVTLTDITVIVEKDYYISKKPSDFEVHSEKSNNDENSRSDDT